MLQLYSNNKGQSILEVIVAMAIFALISAALTTMAVGSFNALIQGGEYTQAEALAQEALEAVKSIKDRAWNENKYDQSAIATSSGYWIFEGEGTNETIDKYTRTITFNDVCRNISDDITACPGIYTDVHSKEVVVTVSWTTGTGKSASVERRALITNWDTNIWPQSDWSGGDGQSIWSNITSYESDDNGVYVADAGQVTLDQTLTAQAYTTWPFSLGANYAYDTDYIEVTGGKAKIKSTGGGGAGGILNPGFENTTDTSYGWPFTTAGNYTYDSGKIEVTGGVAQLLPSSGGSCSGTATACNVFSSEGTCNGQNGCLWTGGASGNTSNSGFDSNSTGWTFNTWDIGGGEVTPTGTWVSSGGNPGGYVNIDIPLNAKNDELGGYWQQSISITENNASVTCSFDWSILNWVAGGGVDDYQFYVFLDSALGAPSVGNAIWSSGSQSGTSAWSGQQNIDCSAVAATAGTYYLKLAVWLDTAKNQDTGPITAGYDNASVSWSASTCTDNPGATACNTYNDQTNCESQDGCSWAGGSYPIDEPSIYPTNPYSATGIQSWDSFTETASKDGGAINYQLSSDGGSTWEYWNGSSWATAGVLNYNSASVINTNISNFSTSTEQIQFKAFLDSDGAQLVQLDNINLSFTPSPTVWNFYTWGAGAGEVTPIGAKQTSGGMPNSYVDITVPQGNNDELGGYWQQSLTTTASNPTATLNFDYKVIDYNGTPNVAEIRVYLDTATGDPVTQVGDSITVSAETNWASSTEIDLTPYLSTPGTYYFKMAYWEETGGNNGPVTVGFDNINLDWSASTYPTSSTTIYNTNAFQPAAITQWLSFTATTTTTGGAQIYYQLSDDDGATWQYWDGDSWEIDPDGYEGASENDFQTATTTDYYINQFSVANKKLSFKAFLVSDGSQYLELDDIRVDYKISEPEYYGNQFYAENFSGAGTMSNSADMTSFRFNAAQDKTVEAIRVYLEDEKGTSPTYRYGLQADNAGEPSGTWLGSTNTGYGDYQATATGWNRIVLNENVTLTSGNTYHLVTEHQSGTINGGNNMELRKSDPANFILPYDGSSNLDSNVLFSGNSGNTWTIQGSQPIYILDYTDVTYEGNPYSSVTEHQIYGINYYGEQFSISGSNNHISSAEFFISENNQGPEGDLELILYDVTNTQTLNTGVIADPSQVRNGEYTWVRFDFPTVTTLEVGNVYRLYLQSPGSLVTAHYLVKSVDNENSSVYNGINYDDTNSFFVSSTNGGSSWVTTEVNKDISGYRFGKTIFNGSGYLISSAYNTSTTSAFNVIEWDQVTPTCSPACEVQMQIQTAPDNNGVPGTWSTTWCGPEGEDGDETDYFASSTGELISTDHNGDQWIRYKATLVGDTTETPILEETRIYYQ